MVFGSNQRSGQQKMPPQFGNYFGDFIIPLRRRVRKYAVFSQVNKKKSRCRKKNCKKTTTTRN